MSLEWVWRDFQIHSSFPKKSKTEKKNKKMKTYEFGASLERVWKISKLTPNSFLFSKKNSKLEKKQRKKWKHMSLERVWSEFGESPNSLQTHKEIFAWCHFSIFFEKKRRNKWVWRTSKLSPNSLQTQKKYAFTTFFLKKICVQPLKKTQKKVVNAYFFWVWREFGDSPNSFFSPFFSFKKENPLKKKNIKQRFLCEFGVSLEILQTLSKLTPNSQRNLCLI